MSPRSDFSWASLLDLRRRTSIKWSQYPADVLPLWVAEMDATLAEPIAAALREAIGRGDTGYPWGTAYAESLQRFAAERWGWDGLAVSRTTVLPDVMMGIVELLKLVTRSGDAVVVNTPVYPPFFAFVEHMDRRIVEAPLGETGRIDLVALEEAFATATAGGATAGYLLCNPHNPTGVVHSMEELARVAVLADSYGVRVVADEIHAPLVLPGAEFVPYLSVPGSENAMSVMAASKGWNIAGLKAALGVAGEAAASDLQRIPEEVSHGASHLAIIAQTAAYDHGRPWLDDLVVALDRNRTLLTRLMIEHLPTVGFQRPEATYLAWLDCRALVGVDPGAPGGRGAVTDLSGPAAMFLERGRVALNSGHVFGTGGEGRVRLNFATSPEILTEAVGRMSRAVESGG